MSENLFNACLKDFIVKKMTLLLTALALIALAGCNTVKGVGQDLQKAGAKIEDVAKKN
jgi:predicted small secreted protein